MPRSIPVLSASVDATALLVFVVKLAGAVAYAVAFSAAYDAYLPRYWSEWGFVIYDKPSFGAILPIVVAIVPAFWLPSKNDRPSTLFSWVIFLVVYVPSIIVAYKITPQLDAGTTEFWFYLLAGFALLSLFTRTARISIDPIVTPGAQSTLLLVGVGLGLFVATIAAFGGSINVLAFNDVYKQRAASRELGVTGLPVYAYFWLSDVLLPLGLVWALHKRSLILFAVCFMGQIAMFGIGASKLAGLVAFAGPALYVFAGRFRRAFGAAMVAAAAAALGLASVLARGQGDFIGLAVSVLVGRTIGTPGLATVQYFRFFQNNPFTYWSHLNIVGWFIGYPYSRPLPYLIGHRLFGLDLLSWNANFWASDGFAALGGPGVLIISVLTGLTLRLLDEACRHLDPRITAAWALAPAMALANIGLFTALLTQGIGIMILIALFLPRTVSRPQLPLPSHNHVAG